MSYSRKRIAVLTSGGDAPGMNACIRAVVRSGVYKGHEVLGVEHGFQGLIEGKMNPMSLSDVADIVHRGGTVLRTARCEAFKTDEGMKAAIEAIKLNYLDGIVAIGGDGTFRGARDLSMGGVPCIAVPGTIDNDLAYTDYTIGFDTAVNTVTKTINNLRDTMMSHDRVSVVEVMGRTCGDIALYAGVAAGAQTILLPEIEVDIDEVVDRIRRGHLRKKNASIIVVAEGLKYSADEIAQILKDRAHVDARVSVLGHIQRGGSPTANDRILATRMGVRAVELIEDGMSNLVVGIVNNQIIDMPIPDALACKASFDYKLYEMSKLVSL